MIMERKWSLKLVTVTKSGLEKLDLKAHGHLNDTLQSGLENLNAHVETHEHPDHMNGMYTCALP